MAIINWCKGWIRKTKWCPITHDALLPMVPYYPWCRKPMKWTTECILFLLQMAAINSFIVFKKYTKHKNQKDKDFILECAQKMTGTARREDENDNGEDKSLALTSTALTPRLHDWRAVADAAGPLQRGLALYSVGWPSTAWAGPLQRGLQIDKMVNVLSNDENNSATMKI